jgi:hypothetical protein
VFRKDKIHKRCAEPYGRASNFLRHTVFRLISQTRHLQQARFSLPSPSRMRPPQVLIALFLALTGVLWGETQPQICKPGPWGRIECHTIYLEAPSWVVEHFPMPSIQPRWSFAGATPMSTRTFLNRAGIDEKTVERWLGDPRCRHDQDALTVYPSVEDIEGLGSGTRTIIYRELAKSDLNTYYKDPVIIPGSSVDEWLRGAKLDKDSVELIRKLSYLEGDTLMFSDYAALLSHCDTEREAQRLVKATTRTRTILATLKVNASDDLESLADYWTAGFRRKDILPMLESIAEQEGGGQIDLAHLLPPLPRKLLYTYPTPDLELTGRTPNCHWTSLNFFNYTPQDLYLDLKLAASRVLAGYTKPKDGPRFGDVLIFADQAGNAHHSCVFVADDLVFTKNGENSAVPWILARLDDVKQVYNRQTGGRIEVYRRRWDTSS